MGRAFLIGPVIKTLPSLRGAGSIPEFGGINMPSNWDATGRAALAISKHINKDIFKKGGMMKSWSLQLMLVPQALQTLWILNPPVPTPPRSV